MKLFYSYSHKDEEFREGLEKHLAVLKQKGHIEDWHDRKILPGQDFQQEIDENLEEADIIALLLSSEFLSSPSCMKEVSDALGLRERRGVSVVPVIVRSCDWKSSDIGKLQALPKDGKPVSEWPDRDAAFLDIVKGITTMTKEMKKLEIRPELKRKMSEVEFVSENKEDIQLQDIFVFPHLVGSEGDLEIPIRDFSHIWDSEKFCLLRGDDRSGKTVLCRKMFLERIEHNQPTLLLSGEEIRNYGHQDIIQKKFKDDFDGKYNAWKKAKDKMVIVDDFNIESGGKFLVFAKDFFDYVFVTVSNDQYAAYYRSQSFLSDFHILDLRPLKHAQQEELIRRWKALGCSDHDREAVADSTVDRLEDTINAIVFRNRIVPRFPFYVLSILQAYEAFIPQDLRLTVYGHFYYVLIVAQLSRAGIAREDLDSAINFLSFFAFDLYRNRKDCYGYSEFSSFLESYKRQYVIKEDMLNNLISSRKPIIKVDDGIYSFRYPFAYYYLLGYYFAKNMNECKSFIEDLTEKSYIRDNMYILIFTIHHSHDDDLIDDIILHTMEAMDNIDVAKLDREETKSLEAALRKIPEKILTEKSVKEARKEERDFRDRLDEHDVKREDHRPTDQIEVNNIYRALKNMVILGQILTNKYGSLPKEKIGEIIVTVGDAGLRLVRLVTLEKTLLEFEDFIVEKMKEIGADPDNVDDRKLEKLRKELRALVFIVVLMLLRKISTSIGGTEISEVVEDVTDRQGTIAYKLIGLIFAFNSTQKVERDLVDRVIEFLRECDKSHNEVVKRIISLEVQSYCNTHNVDFRERQRLFGELKLPYRPNIANPKIPAPGGRRD